MTWRFDAPTASMATTGPRSTASIASAKILPIDPIEPSVIARMPANGPRPTAETNISAKTRSGTDRMMFIVQRAR